MKEGVIESNTVYFHILAWGSEGASGVWPRILSNFGRAKDLAVQYGCPLFKYPITKPESKTTSIL